MTCDLPARYVFWFPFVLMFFLSLPAAFCLPKTFGTSLSSRICFFLSNRFCCCEFAWYLRTSFLFSQQLRNLCNLNTWCFKHFPRTISYSFLTFFDTPQLCKHNLHCFDCFIAFFQLVEMLFEIIRSRRSLLERISFVLRIWYFVGNIVGSAFFWLYLPVVKTARLFWNYIQSKVPQTTIN